MPLFKPVILLTSCSWVPASTKINRPSWKPLLVGGAATSSSVAPAATGFVRALVGQSPRFDKLEDTLDDGKEVGGGRVAITTGAGEAKEGNSVLVVGRGAPCVMSSPPGPGPAIVNGHTELYSIVSG